MGRVPGAVTAAAPLILLALLLPLGAPALDIAPASPGIEIPVRLTERLSSQDAQSGQRFGVETTRAAQIGSVAIPLGTKGHGVVESALSARGQKPGKLVLAMESLDLPDGRAIPVYFSLSNLPKSDDAKGPPVSLGNGHVTIGGYATYGTNVVYEKGTAFSVTPLPPNGFRPAPEPS